MKNGLPWAIRFRVSAQSESRSRTALLGAVMSARAGGGASFPAGSGFGHGRPDRRTSRRLTWVALLLVLMLAAGLTTAQGPYNEYAGLVVDFGDGTIYTACVDLGPDGQATGEEVLRAAGLDILVEYSPMGGAICKISGESDTQGCDFPAEPCWCECMGSPCVYWAYHHLVDGQWEYSTVGASTYVVHGGDVEGWAWGAGTLSQGAQPPVIPFEDLCATATATPTATHTPSPTTPPPPTATPTATWPPTATSTWTPTATPVPTPTWTPLPTATWTPWPTFTPTPTPTQTSTPTPQPTELSSPAPQPTDTPSPTHTAAIVATPTARAPVPQPSTTASARALYRGRTYLPAIERGPGEGAGAAPAVTATPVNEPRATPAASLINSPPASPPTRDQPVIGAPGPAVAPPPIARTRYRRPRPLPLRFQSLAEKADAAQPAEPSAEVTTDYIAVASLILLLSLALGWQHQWRARPRRFWHSRSDGDRPDVAQSGPASRARTSSHGHPLQPSRTAGQAARRWPTTRRHLLGLAIYFLSAASGVVALLYPFLIEIAPAGPLGAVNTARGQDTPLLLTALVSFCFIALLVEIQGQTVSSKLVALLGVLVAINAVLRFVEVGIPGPGGFSPVFFLIVLTGYVYGGRFGFLLGALTMLVSALITGGVGPWLPGQMFTAGWVGLTAPLVRPLARLMAAREGSKRELVILAAFSGAWGLAFGLIMNLWFWPFMAGPATQSWQVGLGLREGLRRYAAFYLATSLVWDLFRLGGNVLLTVAFGTPTLHALRRFRQRFTFEYSPLETTMARPATTNPASLAAIWRHDNGQSSLGRRAYQESVTGSSAFRI